MAERRAKTYKRAGCGDQGLTEAGADSQGDLVG
jgi:hypothetical protein